MTIKIAIIGLGYVGLPLAVAFAKLNKVTGFDIDNQRVNQLNHNTDKTKEISSEELQEVKSNIFFTNSINDLENCNIYIITVPTPVNKDLQPDLSYLIHASTMVASVLKKNDIVIYESTVYPGVTEDICVPELEKASGLKYNSDFYCGYSPERINPGDKVHTLKNILKVTSGSTPEIAEKIDQLYRSIICAGTFKASSIKVAEASKVIENTQRDVNIALINELAMIFHAMDLSTHEVLEAASTKWNFINLRPGLVGGHCIGVDPYYLSFKAEELGYKPNLILGARVINNGMSKYIASNAIKLMLANCIEINRAKVLILGFSFKENCSDIRNTKVIEIFTELREFGCDVEIYDPLVDFEEAKIEYGVSLIKDWKMTKYKMVIYAVSHDHFKSIDFDNDPIIMDIKGISIKPDWRL